MVDSILHLDWSWKRCTASGQYIKKNIIERYRRKFSDDTLAQQQKNIFINKFFFYKFQICADKTF